MKEMWKQYFLKMVCDYWKKIFWDPICQLHYMNITELFLQGASTYAEQILASHFRAPMEQDFQTL